MNRSKSIKNVQFDIISEANLQYKEYILECERILNLNSKKKTETEEKSVFSDNIVDCATSNMKDENKPHPIRVKNDSPIKRDSSVGSKSTESTKNIQRSNSEIDRKRISMKERSNSANEPHKFSKIADVDKKSPLKSTNKSVTNEKSMQKWIEKAQFSKDVNFIKDFRNIKSFYGSASVNGPLSNYEIVEFLNSISLDPE